MSVSDALVTIKDVEILSTGQYAIASPGEITFTTDDLAAAVAAQQDPYVHSPRLKIGHESEFGDGEPSFGKVVNMRLVDDGHTIIGDYVGVPKWLAEILPSAYPSRSIEGAQNATTPDGKTHGLIIDAVALLGVVAPGVATLEDLAGLYEAEAPAGVEITAGARITAKIGGVTMPVAINAATEVEDVRRAYYDQLSEDQMWWWIRAIELDPSALIVDDDAGSLFRVPFSIDSGEPVFEDPQEVRIEYVPAGEVAAMKIAASRGREVAVFASREESLPTSTKEEETNVELTTEQLTKLGLSEDATQEDVDARLAELAPADPAGASTEEEVAETPEAEATEAEETTEADAGVPALASVDPAALEQMRQDAELGRQARQKQLNDERDSLLDSAVSAGKFPPSRKDHWKALYDKDPEGVKASIESLTPGLIPVDEKGGSPSDIAASQDAGYDQGWLSPQERARVSAAQAGDTTGDRVIQEGR